MKQALSLFSATGMWLFIFGLMGPTILAMCVGFFPPGRAVSPADNTKTLVIFNGDQDQSLIVQPEFEGQIEDFALVLPAPSEPKVTEASEDLFNDLEDLTNPTRNNDFWRSEAAFEDSVAPQASSGVTVIETKDVGNYTAQILKSQDDTALREFLNGNGYELSTEALDALSFTSNEYQDPHFVALKVDASKVKDNAWELQPIRLDYQVRSGAPVVPTSILAAAPETLNYTTYVLAPEPYIIPGSDLEYSQEISVSETLTDARSIIQLNPAGQWLTRSRYQIDPELVRSDLQLQRVAAVNANRADAENTKINVSPLEQDDNTAGIVRNSCFALQGTFGFWPTPLLEERTQPLVVEPQEEPDAPLEQSTSPEQIDQDADIIDPFLPERVQPQNSFVDPSECAEQGQQDNLLAAAGEPLTGSGMPVLTYVLITFGMIAAGLTIVGIKLAQTLKKKGTTLKNSPSKAKSFLSKRSSTTLGIFAAIETLISTLLMVWVVTSLVDWMDETGRSWDGSLFWNIVPFVPIAFWVAWVGLLWFSTPAVLWLKRSRKAALSYIGVLIASSVTVGLAAYGLVELL